MAASINSVMIKRPLKVSRMSMELWKEIFDWAAVVLVGLTFAAGAGALITGKILSERQSEQLRQFQLRMESAQQQTALAQKEAADAQLKLDQWLAKKVIARVRAAYELSVAGLWPRWLLLSARQSPRLPEESGHSG